MTRRHYWNSLQPYGPRWFLAVIWTQMQLIVDCMFQRVRRPCVEDLIWLWESTPAMIRMVIMVWGSKPQFSGLRCQCKLCIGILELYLVTKVLWIPWGGPPWNVLAYWNIWHFLLTWCLDLLRETVDIWQGHTVRKPPSKNSIGMLRASGNNQAANWGRLFGQWWRTKRSLSWIGIQVRKDLLWIQDKIVGWSIEICYLETIRLPTEEDCLTWWRTKRSLS